MASKPTNPKPEISAHVDRWSDLVRSRDVDRPWYRYAYTLLPNKEPERWMDMGCGQGELLQHANTKGLSGFGLDITRHNAESTLRLGFPSLVTDLNHPLPFASDSLGGITLIEVIEHVIQAEFLIRELYRVIRPGGWLILTTPNVVHWTYRFRALTGHAPKQEGYHFRFFTKKSLNNILHDSGFTLQNHASFGKNALFTHLLRPIKGPKYKFRYLVPQIAESLLAQHFVWKLKKPISN